MISEETTQTFAKGWFGGGGGVVFFLLQKKKVGLSGTYMFLFRHYYRRVGYARLDTTTMLKLEKRLVRKLGMYITAVRLLLFEGYLFLLLLQDLTNATDCFILVRLICLILGSFFLI